LIGRCSSQLLKTCAGAKMVYLRAERVFIIEHYFASKSFAAVREAFSNAYPDKEVPNKTTVHRLVTKFQDTRRGWIFSVSGVKLFCESFLTNKNYRTSFSCYVDVTAAYK
jgi:hypothetical protein